MNQRPDNMIPVIMESSRAFGTGEHNTTKGCVEAMEAISDMNITSVMDVGTGTGILAIAASKIWPSAEVIGSDIDEVAVKVAEEHAKINNADIELKVADGIPSYSGKVDLIVSNILKEPLIELVGKFHEALSERGVVILSGFLDYQSDEVLEAY